MQKKYIFFALAVVCLLAGGWGYYQYQKPRASTIGTTPAFRMTAQQLFDAYNTNETAADREYSGKVVEVTGTVKEKQETQQVTNVLLDGGALGGVNCTFQPSEARRLHVGEQVNVKGRCTGFLMDVSLVDAIRVDK